LFEKERGFSYNHLISDAGRNACVCQESEISGDQGRDSLIRPGYRRQDTSRRNAVKFDSIDQILDYAIEKEQDAADFYTSLANKMDREYMKQIFSQFAKEEMGHKRKLQGVKEGKFMLSAEKKVMDLKIGDRLTDVDLDAEIDFQQALILAMKAEKAAYRLYNDLAEATDNDDMKNTFHALAQEEAKHKLRFEIEYDDYALRDN
jgi:rubrerythrin